MHMHTQSSSSEGTPHARVQVCTHPHSSKEHSTLLCYVKMSTHVPMCTYAHTCEHTHTFTVHSCAYTGTQTPTRLHICTHHYCRSTHAGGPTVAPLLCWARLQKHTAPRPVAIQAATSEPG